MGAVWRNYPQSLACVVGYGIFVLAYFYFPHFHRTLIVEDGWGEWLQFFAYAVAGLGFLAVAFGARDRRERCRDFGLGLLLIFLAGEEISWGTRCLGYDWTWLSERTTQGSSDFHNLVPLHGNRGIYFVFLGLVGPMAAFLENKVGEKFFPAPAVCRDFAWPDRVSSHWLALVTLGLLWSSPMLFIWEFTEALIALSFLAMLGRRLGKKVSCRLFIIVLALATTAAFFDWGDSNRLNYGGLEWGAHPPAAKSPQ